MPKKGWKPSPATRKLWSDARKGSGNGFFGKRHSSGTKKIMGDKKEGKPHFWTDSARKKNSDSHKGIHHSEKTIALLKIIQKARFSNRPGPMSGRHHKESSLIKMRNHKSGWGRRETGIEKKIKEMLVSCGIKFKQEHRFLDLRIFVDFFLPDYGFVIECDGDYWHNRPGAPETDANRDAALRKKGLRVLRFPEHEINKNFDVVRAKLYHALELYP